MSSKIRFALALLLVVPAVTLAGVVKDPNAPRQSIIDTVVNCATATGNPVMNCGFESGDLTSWLQSGDLSFTSVTTGAAHSGTYGLNTGPTGSLGCITQFLDTPVFLNYDLSLWLRNSGQPNEFQAFWNGALVMDWSYVANIPYQQISFQNLPTPGVTTELDFCFFNPPDFFDFDDVVASGH